MKENQIKPLVTVVIPCYNYAEKIERSIKSVQSQTLSNFECFIVDDGSTDNTAGTVENVIAGDKRFKYIYQDNSGVANARNKGVFSGTGKYVCCLDADDALEPEFLEVCVTALEGNRSIGIAYTGLFYVKPDGTSGLSQWPPEFDYEKQLRTQNMIPTCNVARRSVWERLGGQRQRYAPFGAGEEDAEMWLRAGSIGVMAKKVSAKGLFIYSWQSGRVSGNKEHKITDYRKWHPWTKDSHHPFASIANSPKGSHPVHQYDRPYVSVIIPVGPNHTKKLYDALDSLEAQTFRDWEAIVVWDNAQSGRTRTYETEHEMEIIERAYPFVKYVKIHANSAGVARNVGANKASAPLLLFLDADDWLVPETLQEMILAYDIENSIIYTDYFGQSFVDKETAEKFKERLLFYNDKNNEALVLYRSSDYNCLRAVNQPDSDMYIWCLISSLVPKKWHNEIGGFDENMHTWEDWDYWLRMARAGKCFYRIEKPLIGYRFYTGSRRELGIHHWDTLIEYLKEKFKDIEIMPCNCGNKRTSRQISTNLPPMRSSSTIEKQPEDDRDKLIEVYYNSPNRGQHLVVGSMTRKRYGYFGGGARIVIHKSDYFAQNWLFTPVDQTGASRNENVLPPVPETPRNIGDDNIEVPSIIKSTIDDAKYGKFDLQTIPGITPSIARYLNSLGVHSLDDVKAMTLEQLMSVKGIAENRAKIIKKYMDDLEKE